MCPDSHHQSLLHGSEPMSPGPPALGLPDATALKASGGAAATETAGDLPQPAGTLLAHRSLSPTCAGEPLSVTRPHTHTGVRP